MGLALLAGWHSCTVTSPASKSLFKCLLSKRHLMLWKMSSTKPVLHHMGMSHHLHRVTNQVTSSRQDESDARQSAARAEGNADQRQDTKGRHLRPHSGRQSRHDEQPRDLDVRGRHSARQGHGDPNHSPRKGRQINEQDTRYIALLCAQMHSQELQWYMYQLCQCCTVSVTMLLRCGFVAQLDLAEVTVY